MPGVSPDLSLLSTQSRLLSFSIHARKQAFHAGPVGGSVGRPDCSTSRPQEKSKLRLLGTGFPMVGVITFGLCVRLGHVLADFGFTIVL